MQNELGMRLSAAAALVLPGKTAADIGSDHMLLPMHLAEKGVCPRVIAADKVPLACKKGEALIAMAGLSHLIEVRCGDGLQVLRPGEAATIIITGMGGRLIRDILAGREATAVAAERLVLSPQKDAALLRNYLASSGWRIVNETAVFEAEKYYVMIAAERGEMDPLDIMANQYDLVINGYESASGAVRNHDPEIMIKAFELVRLGEEDVKKKFPAMYNAFCYGAPPHAGCAPGIDRIVMLLTGEESIREVITFPMNQKAQDLMMGAPSEVTQKQLDELHIAIVGEPEE